MSVKDLILRRKWPITAFILELRNNGNEVYFWEDKARRVKINDKYVLTFKKYNVIKWNIRNELIYKTNTGKHYAFFLANAGKGYLVQVPPIIKRGFVLSYEEKKKIEDELDTLPDFSQDYLDRLKEELQRLEEEKQEMEQGLLSDKLNDTEIQMTKKELNNINARIKEINKYLEMVEKTPDDEKARIMKRREELIAQLDAESLSLLPPISPEAINELAETIAESYRKYEDKSLLRQIMPFIVILIVGIVVIILVSLAIQGSINAAELVAKDNLEASRNVAQALMNTMKNMGGGAPPGAPPA